MTYTLPFNRVQNYIGDIGEHIFEEFLVNNDINIVGKEFSFRSYKNTGNSIRVDYILCNDKSKIIELEEKIKNEMKTNENISMEVHEKITRFEFLNLLDSAMRTGSGGRSRFFIRIGDSLKIYDCTSCYDLLWEKNKDSGRIVGIVPHDLFNYVVDNFCLVEVKTTISKKFGNRIRVTENQYFLEYEDCIIRIRLKRYYDNGFLGILNNIDLRDFYEKLNLIYKEDEISTTVKLNKDTSSNMIFKILTIMVRNYFEKYDFYVCQRENQHIIMTNETNDRLEEWKYISKYISDNTIPLPHMINSNFLTNMSNKVKKSKRLCKENNLILFRYKIEKKEKYSNYLDHEVYIISLYDAINKIRHKFYPNSDEEYIKIVDFYKNGDIYLWDYNKEKKEYDEYENKKFKFDIEVSIENKLIPDRQEYDIDFTLHINFKPCFENGFEMQINEDDLEMIFNKLLRNEHIST